jgi:hypothetical protein
MFRYLVPPTPVVAKPQRDVAAISNVLASVDCRRALSGRRQRENRNEMKIDTEIRHVTKPGANIFLDLGFAPEEAKRLLSCVPQTD